MSDAGGPMVWHHGLVARWWAEFNTDGPEIGYFGELLRGLGGPALDVACGAGRLLIPLLQAGHDVDGCDISADMLAHCRARAASEGLRVDLYRQATHELNLPRRYRAIVMCGAFGLGGVRAHDEEALRRLHDHLEPGGTLLLDHYLPYESAAEWRHWTAAGQRELPLPWPEAGSRRLTADGDELELSARLTALDPLDQVATREVRVRRWREGRVVEQEERSLKERLYFRNEALAMLAAAGFADVAVAEGYTGDGPVPGSGILVYHARKERLSE